MTIRDDTSRDKATTSPPTAAPSFQTAPEDVPNSSVVRHVGGAAIPGAIRYSVSTQEHPNSHAASDDDEPWYEPPSQQDATLAVSAWNNNALAIVEATVVTDVPDRSTAKVYEAVPVPNWSNRKWHGLVVLLVLMALIAIIVGVSVPLSRPEDQSMLQSLTWVANSSVEDTARRLPKETVNKSKPTCN